MIIGFDFTEPVFMHAILHVQDDLRTEFVMDDNELKYFFQKYEIYIGNSPVYTENQKCSDGPFLDPDLRSAYVFDS